MNRTGSATIEACLSLGLTIGLIVMALWMTLFGAYTITLKRWAARHSKCVVITDSPEMCTAQMCDQLKKHFFVSGCHIQIQKHSGQVKTVVRAELPFFRKPELRTHYILYPFEYRRTR